MPTPGAGDSGAAVPFRLTLDEPAELPICLMHVGADAEVLAGLELAGLRTRVDAGFETGWTPGWGQQ